MPSRHIGTRAFLVHENEVKTFTAMNILQKIVQSTRELVSSRKHLVSVAALKSSPNFAAPTLSLEKALVGRRPRIIAEIKKASPSQGIIRHEFDAALIARQYKAAGAAAISVLTEPTAFRGSLDHLALVRRTVDLPLLRKDFIVDPYQLYEARAYGADAVLLLANVLERSELFDLHAEAESLGLSCLVEVYEPEELEKLDFTQVRVLGVNNRDLRTFDIDVAHSLRVFQQVPDSIVRVSESGLKTPHHLSYLCENGVNAFLIGETFMRAADPGRALSCLLEDSRALLSPSHLKRVV